MRFLKRNITILFLISQLLYSQSTIFDSSSTDSVTQNSNQFEKLPTGYRSIELGQTFKEVKDLLLLEPRFDFRGDPDVSIQKDGNQSLISSKGRMFIDQGFFQFDEDKLFLIILQLNKTKIDFFSIQQTMTARYGPPTDLSPEGMFWFNDKVKLSLEYPLTVKYLDLEVFNSFIDEDERLKSFQEVARSEFLGDF